MYKMKVVKILTMFVLHMILLMWVNRDTLTEVMKCEIDNPADSLKMSVCIDSVVSKNYIIYVLNIPIIWNFLLQTNHVLGRT